MAVSNITTIPDVTTIVANTTNMMCTNFAQSDLIFRIPMTALSPLPTCPAFFLWLRWSSSRGLQVIAIQRTKQFDNFHNILIPFRPSFPSIRIYLLLNDQSSFQASSCIVRLVSIFCLHKSGNVVSNLLKL